MRWSTSSLCIARFNSRSQQCLYAYVSRSFSRSINTPSITSKEVSESLDAFRRQRKTEWKRKQGGETFLDNLIVTVRAGKGGDGCVAFHREKYKPYGPPSGGNGGKGGDVYFLPSSSVTTLSTIPKRIRGEVGGNGKGSWQHGKNGAPLIIKVPLGTIVRQLPRDDPRCAQDEWEAEEESLAELGPEDKRNKMRDLRWIAYPGGGESGFVRDFFKDAEAAAYKQERERRFLRRKKDIEQPISLDLDEEHTHERHVDAPLGIKHQAPIGHLIASGGVGGLGNPHFLSTDNRSPKFASRGNPGERITLSLELKLLADIGLVGMPNAGKSTLLRALTGGRAKTEIAGYAFTTLNPIVGVVRLAEDGTFEGSLSNQQIHDETRLEEERYSEKMQKGDFAHAPTRNQRLDGGEFRPGHGFDLDERFRFTIADNPGLISEASNNVGLGHSFLRSIERSLALVYVVDLSGPAPWDELEVLRQELEKYQPGMSAKARMIVANKADLMGAGGDRSAVQEAKDKLAKLQEFVKQHLTSAGAAPLDVIPVSAKYSQNLSSIVGRMKAYVEEARSKPTSFADE